MLKVLRDNLKYLSWVLWLVIAVFILFVFVDFGGSVPGGNPTSDAAVTVAGHDITYGEFERAYRQTEDTYRQIYGDQFSGETAKQLGLPMQVLNGLVADRILLLEAERMDLEVTDAELQREILGFPVFKGENGAFVGPDEYERILRNAGMTSDVFEGQMRQELLTKKVRNLLASSVFVADSEIEETYRRRTEQARIRFIELPWDSVDETIEISDEEASAYFEENRESFRIPERRVIDYLLVNRREIQESLTLEEGATRAYYDENPAEFTQQEQVRARHILLQVNNERSSDEARSLLAETRQRIAGGEDFAILAAELSDDPGSKTRGGDLGLFGRGDMVEPFDRAAFDAEVGDLVGPVETDFGMHLIEVLEKRPGGTADFTVAEEGIRARLLAERAQTAAEAKATQLAEMLGKQDAADPASLAASETGVTFQTTPAFGRDDNVPGIGRAGQFTVSAFDVAAGEVSEPIAVGQGWAILRLNSVEEPRLPELAEVKNDVSAALRESKLRQWTIDRLAAEALRLADGGNLDNAATRLDLEVQETALFGRDDQVGTLGRAPAVAEAALDLEEGGVGGPVEIDNGAVLFEVLERRRFESQQFAQEKESTRQAIEAQRLNEILSVLLDKRQNELEIHYDTQLMANFGLDNLATES